MKKIIDRKDNLVEDMLNGYELAYLNRVKVVNGFILTRKHPKELGKVGVMIGNGSGHEPAMIDLVGRGLFDVNVCGRIFTAPSPLDMIQGIKLADRGAGVLILVSSHQGDILNAKMAVMLAKAEGINAKMVVLWDDMFSAPKGMESERRGTAGLFFTFKIVCQCAEEGYSMDELISMAEAVRDNTRTLTVAVEGGTHPETGLKTFELPEDEIEVGMGVHGEAGSGRMKITSAEKIVKYLLDNITEDKPFIDNDKVLVLVNNCGSTTRMELMIIYKNIVKYLKRKNIEIVGNFVGTYVTTQEMAGVAISLCKVNEKEKELFLAPCDSTLF
ncbi:MAG TPA: dihydroxyacetone kinase subunit DhaK [Victivallales bacterium]|nr:dihydroxyacetone kinase subunit DhaK [Victivallales bacterium]